MLKFAGKYLKCGKAWIGEKGELYGGGATAATVWTTELSQTRESSVFVTELFNDPRKFWRFDDTVEWAIHNASCFVVRDKLIPVLWNYVIKWRKYVYINLNDVNIKLNKIAGYPALFEDAEIIYLSVPCTDGWRLYMVTYTEGSCKS